MRKQDSCKKKKKKKKKKRENKRIHVLFKIKFFISNLLV